MKSLYLRIYLTVVLVLLAFAAASGWVFQRHIEQERVRAESMLTERMGAWAELIQRSLPGIDAAPADQASALRDWSQRLRLPLALDSASGMRIGESDSFTRRQSEGVGRTIAVRLEDGRTLWLMRPSSRRTAIVRPTPSDWRRVNDSDSPMRMPLALSSASGSRKRCDQSRRALAWSAGAASMPGSDRWISSAQAPMRSVSIDSARTRSCSMWRWNTQPDAAAKASSTSTTVR